MPSSTDPIALSCARYASLLGLAAVATGGYVAAAQSKLVPADPDMALASHVNAWLGMFTLLGVGWTAPMLSSSERTKRLMTGLLVVATVSNVAVTALKAWWGVHGVVPDADPWNDTIAVLLNVLVVAPTSAGLGLWAWGLWRR